MLFRGVPLRCRCRGDTHARMCQAEDRPKHHRSSVDQLAASNRRRLSELREELEEAKGTKSVNRHRACLAGMRISKRRGSILAAWVTRARCSTNKPQQMGEVSEPLGVPLDERIFRRSRQSS